MHQTAVVVMIVQLCENRAGNEMYVEHGAVTVSRPRVPKMMQTDPWEFTVGTDVA